MYKINGAKGRKYGRAWKLSAWIVSVVGVAACSDGPTGPSGPVEPITELPRALTSSEVEVISASNHFAFELARRVSADAPDRSFFLSPLSASMALGMTLNGADGNTFEEMRTVLGFEGLSREEINASYRGLLDLLLNLDSSVETVLANSAWIRSGFEVFDSFTDVLEADFDARVGVLDFNDPSSAEVMNGWASEATNGRIEDVIAPPIDPEAVMFLMNALFFKGTWTTRFDPGDTRTEPFHLRDGGTEDVRMMRLEDEIIGYHSTDTYAVGELPYGGGAFAMTVVVPEEGVMLESVLQDLDGQEWEEMMGEMGEGLMNVEFPRFRLEYERSLVEDLKAMGMIDAFQPSTADFSRLTSTGGLFVDKVQQKTWVEVNEEGTEAAAATVVGIGITSAPRVFRADRPFLFAIRERLSGTVLFLGAVVEPPQG